MKRIDPTDENMRLLELAVYQETNGLRNATTSDKILRRWRYFWGLIDRGSFKTVDELEERVYSSEAVTGSRDEGKDRRD